LSGQRLGQRDADDDVSALVVAGAVSATSSQKPSYNTYHAEKQTYYGDKRDLSHYGAPQTAFLLFLKWYFF
jgi:hypothetical protein